MKNILVYLSKRLNEPSTYAGIGVVAMTVAPFIEKAAHAGNMGGAVVAVLSGIIAAITAEGGAK